MDTESNRAVERPADRGTITEFYAGFNRLATDRGERDELAATLADDVTWTVATNGALSERSYTGIDAVVEHVAVPARETATHLQALPERFVEADETVVVEGAYVETTDEAAFDVAFVHVFEPDDGLIRACREYTDTAHERRVFGPYERACGIDRSTADTDSN